MGDLAEAAGLLTQLRRQGTITSVGLVHISFQQIGAQEFALLS